MWERPQCRDHKGLIGTPRSLPHFDYLLIATHRCAHASRPRLARRACNLSRPRNQDVDATPSSRFVGTRSGRGLWLVQAYGSESAASTLLCRAFKQCYQRSSGGLIPNFSNIFLTLSLFSGVSNLDSSGYSAQNSTSR